MGTDEAERIRNMLRAGVIKKQKVGNRFDTTRYHLPYCNLEESPEQCEFFQAKVFGSGSSYIDGVSIEEKYYAAKALAEEVTWERDPYAFQVEWEDFERAWDKLNYAS